MVLNELYGEKMFHISQPRTSFYSLVVGVFHSFSPFVSAPPSLFCCSPVFILSLSPSVVASLWLELLNGSIVSLKGEAEQQDR